MQHLRNKGTEDAEGLRKTIKNCKLSLFDQFNLVLEKLRVGTLNQLLADNFNISHTTVTEFLSPGLIFFTLCWEVFSFGHLGQRFRIIC